MATFTAEDCRLLVNEYDFTGYTNQISLVLGAESEDETTFGDTTRTHKAGLLTNSLDASGFVDFAEITSGTDDSVDEHWFTEIGTNDGLLTVCPVGFGTAGDYAYTGLWQQTQYTPGAQVGSLLGWDISAQGRSRLTKATIMADASATISSTGATSKRELGAVAAGNQLVAVVHVYAATSVTTLDFAVESDADGSAGGETSRGTFTQLTGVGSERITIAAPITDTFWRVTYTLSGTSFKALMVLGIESLT